MNRQYGALSGVAICLIILNHTLTAVHMFWPATGWWHRVVSVFQAVGVFAVPTFLFISGAFVAYAARGKSSLSFKFVWTSIKHILWPYLIWTFLYYTVLTITRDRQESLPQYLHYLLTGEPYHFVPLLMLFYLVSPLLVMLGERLGWLVLLAVGLYQLFLLHVINPGIFGSVAPGWMWHLTPPVVRETLSNWAIFFPMGLVFSMHNGRVKPYLLRFKWVSFWAALGLFVLGVLNLFGVVAAPWARFLAPFPLMLLLPIIDRNRIPFLARFEQVGRRSYGIYLAHFIVLDLVPFILVSVIPGTFQFVVSWLGYLLSEKMATAVIVYPLLFGAALFIPLWVMEWASKRPSTRKIYRYIFG